MACECSVSQSVASVVSFCAANVGRVATGSAARFYQPSGLAVDSVGNLFVADTGNHAIREISPDGAVTTLAGSAGDPGYVDGAIVTSRFNRPSDVAVDAADNVYVIDLGNQKVRKIMPSGLVTMACSRVMAGNTSSVTTRSAPTCGVTARMVPIVMVLTE